MGSFYISIFLLVILVQSCCGCNTKIPNIVEEPGVFAKCQNKWCLQKGLQKPQHTKCESVTNNGKTCNNPEIKYGTVSGGLPWEYSSNYYVKWCEQLGGRYRSHTTGTRTGYIVYGCHGADDPGYWKWCNSWGDGKWYNQSLAYSGRQDLRPHRNKTKYHRTSNNFITSITCNNWIKICDFKSQMLASLI